MLERMYTTTIKGSTIASCTNCSLLLSGEICFESVSIQEPIAEVEAKLLRGEKENPEIGHNVGCIEMNQSSMIRKEIFKGCS